MKFEKEISSNCDNPWWKPSYINFFQDIQNKSNCFKQPNWFQKNNRNWTYWKKNTQFIVIWFDIHIVKIEPNHTLYLY